MKWGRKKTSPLIESTKLCKKTFFLSKTKQKQMFFGHPEQFLLTMHCVSQPCISRWEKTQKQEKNGRGRRQVSIHFLPLTLFFLPLSVINFLSGNFWESVFLLFEWRYDLAVYFVCIRGIKTSNYQGHGVWVCPIKRGSCLCISLIHQSGLGCMHVVDVNVC